jgi:hypothetical protein
MAHSQAKLKSSGDKVSPYFRPFWKGKLSDKCLLLWTLLHVSFKILISVTSFTGSSNSKSTVLIQYFPPN